MSLVAKLFGRASLAKDLDEELRAHVAQRADDLERAGRPRAEAERRARIEFGGFEHYREESHHAARGSYATNLVRDLRYSLRVLRRSPGFLFVAVSTLAFAIGANAVVFSLLNAIVLRPLDVPDGKNIYQIEGAINRQPQQSYPDVDLRDHIRAFDGLAAYEISTAAIDPDGKPVQAWLYTASGNYFDVLRIQPYLGRFFHSPDEHGRNSAPYIVLSFDYFPILQSPSGETLMLVRSNRTATDLAPVVEESLRGLDPTLPLIINTWEKELGTALLAARASSMALGVVGGLGALLATTGIFGMAAYSVSKRMRELGIRIALGARRQAILRTALGRVARLLAIGSAVGLLLGVAATKLLSYIVYQATPRDPVVLGGVVLTMLLLGLIAAWIPAQRALGADPVALLREE